MSGSKCDRCGERVWSETAKDTALGIVSLGMSVPFTTLSQFLCPTCQRELRNRGENPDDWEDDSGFTMKFP